jgi:hypothetical protein
MARVLIVQGHARSRADTAATLRAEGHDVLDAGSADHGVRLLFLPGSPPNAAGQRGTGTAVADLDIVTRLGLALRTKALNDELRLGKDPLADPRLQAWFGDHIDWMTKEVLEIHEQPGQVEQASPQDHRSTADRPRRPPLVCSQ